MRKLPPALTGEEKLMRARVQQARQDLRETIDGLTHVIIAHNAAVTLTVGTEVDPATGETVPLTANRAMQIRMGADISLRLLGKVLPDLKAVEVRGGSEAGFTFVMQMGGATPPPVAPRVSENGAVVSVQDVPLDVDEDMPPDFR